MSFLILVVFLTGRISGPRSAGEDNLEEEKKKKSDLRMDVLLFLIIFAAIIFAVIFIYQYNSYDVAKIK